MARILLLLLVIASALGVALLPGARPAQANPFTDAVAIAAGGHLTCVITTEGGVKCWGENLSGAVGDGTIERRTTPVDVVGLESGVAAIAVGVGSVGHACALTTAGGLKCWGSNLFGQLGIPPEDAERCFDGEVILFGDSLGAPCSTVPIDVPGLESGVAAMAAGVKNTCAVMTQGGVKCWGRNYSGQVGDGTTINRTTPVDVCQTYDRDEEVCVENLTGVTAATVGFDHTCALTIEGRVLCWGSAGGSGSRLGAPASEECLLLPCSTTPVQVCQRKSDDSDTCSEPLTDVRAVVAGWVHTCALASSGVLACWGANGLGDLGDGERCGPACREPVEVCADAECSAPLSDVASLGVGVISTCAVTAAGGVKCWGGNFHGVLGDGTETNSSTPVDVVGLSSGGVAVAAGHHACALLSAGNVKCWGTNCCGNLGIGTIDFVPHPTPLDVLAQAKPTPTPAATVTSPPATETAPATATPTASSTPSTPAGDADCDGVANSIDAALILQFDAALWPSLPCPQAADLNNDGRVNSLDAALVLQRVAGLVPLLTLPPGGSAVSQSPRV